MDIQQFITAIEAHTKALLTHAAAIAGSGAAAPAAQRGRPAKGETAGAADAKPAATTTAVPAATVPAAGVNLRKEVSALLVAKAKEKGSQFAKDAMAKFDAATYDKVTDANLPALRDALNEVVGAADGDLASLLG